MSAPTSLRDLTSISARRSVCCDCGTGIEQTGIQIGDKVSWSPVRCATCAEARSAELEADAKREKILTSQGRRALVERDAMKALEDLAVPPRYQAVTLQGFQFHGSPADQSIQQDVVRKGLRYIAAWPEHDHDILALRGEPGTGKGHWVWSVVKAIVGATGARIRVVKCSDLVRRLRGSWGRELAESEVDALKFFRELDLLVIDEVSTHAFYGQNIHQHLYDVIDHRVEYCRPTVLTSNETIPGLEAILRPALVDRLLHRGGVLEFGSASFRALAR